MDSGPKKQPYPFRNVLGDLGIMTFLKNPHSWRFNEARYRDVTHFVIRFVIHRLDKDTTGLLLFAKTDDALSLLGRAIEARKITREYLAIAWGNFPQDKGLIEAPIGRNILDRKKMAVTPFSAKTAATGFEVIKRFNIATYLRLRLLTGRTHQIRVHLTHYGHPVVGDPEYGGRSKTIINQQSDVAIFKKILSIINRQALHAHKLGFIHPRTGKYIEFTAPLPEDIANLLKYLHSL